MKYLCLLLAVLVAGCATSSSSVAAREDDVAPSAASFEDLVFVVAEHDDVTEYSFVKDDVLYEVNESVGRMFCDGMECALDEESIEMIHLLPEYRERVVPKAFVYHGELYVDTGYIDGRIRCGNMDGFFVSTVDSDQLPAKELERNFSFERDEDSFFDGFQIDIPPYLTVPLADGFHYFAKRSLRNDTELPDGVRYVTGEVIAVENETCRLKVDATNDFHANEGDEVSFAASGVASQDKVKVYYGYMDEGTLNLVYQVDAQ